MNIKPDPNHHIYLQTLSRMTPEQRLLKAIELSERKGEEKLSIYHRFKL